MIYKELVEKILIENLAILSSINEDDITKFVDYIINIVNKNGKIMGYSAGRMGFGLKAFLMRLNHLGVPAYWFGDNYIPPMNNNDMFICCSNSGSTKSVANILDIFNNKSGGTSISFVGNKDSYIGTHCTLPIVFKTCNGGLNSSDDDTKYNSIQPMTTLTEQAMFILFDAVVMKIIERLNINIKDTKKFHSNIE